MSFSVVEVIDGDTIKVQPGWTWNGQSGELVRVLGYDSPESSQFGFEAAKKKLSGLVLNKDVELRNCVKITYGRILCEVYVAGINVARYFNKSFV